MSSDDYNSEHAKLSEVLMQPAYPNEGANLATLVDQLFSAKADIRPVATANPQNAITETGYDRVRTGLSPNPRPVMLQGKRRRTNPLKQPCVYSTLPPLSRLQHAKSNSTSSIYTGNHLTSPRTSEIVASVSTMIHCQLIQDYDRDRTGQRFNIPILNEHHYTHQTVTDFPTVTHVCQFIRGVFDVGQFHPETCIMTLIYMNRFIARTGVALTKHNWKVVFTMSLVIAQKVWDDTPLVNSDFSILYPALNIKNINALERFMLDHVEFDLAVSPQVYAEYFFDLRGISEELARVANDKSPLNPIPRWEATRSHFSEHYTRNKVYYKQRITSPEDIQLSSYDPYHVLS